jgi:hypothetical protein
MQLAKNYLTDADIEQRHWLARALLNIGRYQMPVEEMKAS